MMYFGKLTGKVSDEELRAKVDAEFESATTILCVNPDGVGNVPPRTRKRTGLSKEAQAYLDDFNATAITTMEEVKRMLNEATFFTPDGVNAGIQIAKKNENDSRVKA